MRLIKLLLLSAFFFAPLALLAEGIEVTLVDGTELDCSASTSIPAACVAPDGTRYLIRADERSANAISLASDGSFNVMIMPKQVKWDDQIIYEAISFPGSGFPGMGMPAPRTGQQAPPQFTPPPRPRSTFRSDFLIYTGALSSLDFTAFGATDEAAIKLSEEMRTIAQSKLAEVSEYANPKNIEVEYDQGKKSSCELIPPKQADMVCTIYRCQEPESGFYIDSQFGTPTIISLGPNQKIQSNDSVDIVWNPLNRERPVVENIPFNTSLGGYGMFGSYGMSPELQQQAQRFRIQSQRQRPTLEQPRSQTLQSLNDPMSRSFLTSLVESCDENAIKPLKEGITSFRNEIADAEMVQLIEVTNNVLSSRLINPGAIPENACRDGETWYRGQSYEFSREIIANSSPKTIDMETATRLFNEARAMDDISWNYKADGCYARAHLMARRFEEQGIHVDKVWIKGDLRVPEAGIQWNFHVAPIVYVEDSAGNVQKMVIDPSLMDGPVPVAQWSAKMEKGVVGETIETPYPFPGNVMNLERTAIAYSSSDPYLPYDQISMSEEEKMRQSNETMVRYLGYSQ